MHDDDPVLLEYNTFREQFYTISNDANLVSQELLL